MAGTVVAHRCIDKLIVLMGSLLAEEVKEQKYYYYLDTLTKNTAIIFCRFLTYNHCLPIESGHWCITPSYSLHLLYYYFLLLQMLCFYINCLPNSGLIRHFGDHRSRRSYHRLPTFRKIVISFRSFIF